MEGVPGFFQAASGLIPGGNPVPFPNSCTEHMGSYFEELWFVAKTGSLTLIKDLFKKKFSLA